MGRSMATAGHERVGYGRPPNRTKFKPGQSGNPSGRPKHGKSIEDTITRLLDKESVVNVKGVPTKLTRREILAHKLIEKAYGDTRTAQYLLALDQQVLDREAEKDNQADENDAGLARIILTFIQATRCIPADEFRDVLRALVSTTHGVRACAGAIYALRRGPEAERRKKTFFKVGDTIPDDYDPDKPLPAEPGEDEHPESPKAPDDWG